MNRYCRKNDVYNNWVPSGVVSKIMEKAEHVPWKELTPQERIILIRQKGRLKRVNSTRAECPGDDQRWLIP